MGLFHDILLVVPVLLFSFVAHEFAHGYAAFRQGDRTAHDLGLLNWNPRTYVDPWLTVILPLLTWVFSHGQMILGGARSAPLDARNYRSPRLGDIIVSLAGVTANFLIAILAAVIFVALGLAGRALAGAESSFAIVQAMCIIAVQLNFFLVLFNLMPIPPLDGSHVVKHLLPRRLAVIYTRLAPYGMLLLIVLIYFGEGVLFAWLLPATLASSAVGHRIAPFTLPSTWQWLGASAPTSAIAP